MKPKEYLHSIGAIETIGRGRLSGAHIDLCKAAAAKGVQIDGYVVAKSTTTKGEPATEPTVTKVTKVADGIADLPPHMRDEDELEAYTNEGPVGMRTIEVTCGNSLTYCGCPKPVVRVDHLRTALVFFKKRNKPRPRFW